MSRFFTPEFFVDPYPTYDEVRVEPVHWEEELGGWVLTGYAEVAAALADPRVSRGRGPQEDEKEEAHDGRVRRAKCGVEWESKK